MSDDDTGIEGRPPDPFVAGRISDPSEPPSPSFDLAGLLGDSDREGYRRLYLSTSLDYYVQFRSADVLAVASVPPDTPPFVGLDATRVTLTRDATVDYVRSHAGPPDAFDLDPQTALPAGGQAEPLGTFPPDLTRTLPTDLTGTLPQTFRCVPETLDDCFRTRLTCLNALCFTRQTCQVTNCNTCGQATCQTCFQATCQTCGQATCRTCNNQVTCRTCNLADCWHTLVRTCNFCISQAIRCPTMACP